MSGYRSWLLERKQTQGSDIASFLNFENIFSSFRIVGMQLRMFFFFIVRNPITVFPSKSREVYLSIPIGHLKAETIFGLNEQLLQEHRSGKKTQHSEET